MLDVTIEHDVPATMCDGVVLRADVYRPTTGGPWPVLLTRLPYGKNTPMFAAMLGSVGIARRGFLVVVQDTRGRFASDGEWEPWTFEREDGYDTVRWATALPGSNGSVGMCGGSYLGNTQWMAALAKPPELKAISPRITWSEPDDGLFARGGAAELGITVPWSLMQGVDILLRRHADDSMARGQALMALVGDLDAVATTTYWELPAGQHPVFERHGIPELGFERSRREPDWSASCRVAGRQAEVDLPSLHTGGWYDIFCQGTLDNFTATRSAGRPAKLVMGPWSHIGTMGYLGEVNFGTAASTELMGFRGPLADLELDWFRQWLAPDAVDDGAPRPGLPQVLLFVMGINQGREEQEWPLGRAIDTDLFLRANDRLAFDAPGAGERTGAFTYDPTDPVPTTGGALLMSNEFLPGPLDQARVEARPDVLVFTSDPVAEDLEVTGRIQAYLTAATAPTTDWVVRLCDVDTEGVSRNIVDGIVRAVATPGEFTEQVIDLWSTSYVFRAGHRIRVHVTSSNFPRWDRNLNTGEPIEQCTRSRPARQEIAHDATNPSRIVLPVIPAPTKG
ncbi:CocE/NonD family hydrolase [Nocardia sp. NPDC023852]|uniref:CocE/NonD family hydrolase n=1 Tax=Nocardia sp. NPDC023852 TaxID=3154697 RepID=UPI0033EECD58